MAQEKIIIAMSGGVDSSVAALELKNAGYKPIGVTIRTWPKEDCGSTGEKLCCNLESIQYARSVAEDIGIPFHVVDYSKEFEKDITEYFAEEYSVGRTPSPCIYCNSKIKFGYLFDKAKELGADKIATGHYARIIEKQGDLFLCEGKDSKKDQSYFLYDIPKSNLSRIVFPLGAYNKIYIRKKAVEEGFPNADRQESQDICFATSGDYREYIQGKVDKTAFTPGDVVDINGNVVGRHEGIAAYTVGQRKGLGIAMGRPVYVINIDAVNNRVMIGEKEHAMKKRIRVSGINWLTHIPAGTVDLAVKIRYASAKAGARLTFQDENTIHVEFDQAQFAPTPGQAAVFYDGEIVAGGGWIDEVLE